MAPDVDVSGVGSHRFGCRRCFLWIDRRKYSSAYFTDFAFLSDLKPPGRPDEFYIITKPLCFKTRFFVCQSLRCIDAWECVLTSLHFFRLSFFSSNGMLVALV